MKSLNTTKSILLLTASIALASCGGVTTYNEFARAGDTVAIAAGWQPNFSKNNVSVSILPSSGPLISIPAGDPSIRAVINLYPDPISSLNVSHETGQDLTSSATTYSSQINFETNGDRDWFQTTIFVDLPNTLPTGLTNIGVTNGAGDSAASTVEIIAGTGTPSTFNADIAGPLLPQMMDSMTRLPHFTVEFQSASLPHAIEINMAHNPDAANGGIGKAFAVNPTGFKKNLSWTDDGTNMKAILLPAEDTTITSIKDYKFYVAGGISGLIISDITGYDINGSIVPGVTATITTSN